MCGFVFSKNVSDESFTQLTKSLESIKHRGPDNTKILKKDYGIFGFNRLSIMDLSFHGNQPFEDENSIVICNGEIYNYSLIKQTKASNYKYQSNSDCEVLCALFEGNNITHLLENIDGEYAFILYDKRNDNLFAARDPMGIRPLFYAYDKDKEIWFSSEVKSLLHCDEIKPFPPGHYYDHSKKEIIPFLELYKTIKNHDNEEVVKKEINNLLTKAVEKRMDSDAPVGFLLSGGLDSSLVCSIAQKMSNKPIKTFAVGIETNPIDTKWAKKVADYIGSDHTEVLFTEKDIQDSLKHIIWLLETWDITTIRASVGMYLVCKYIKEHTDIKVLMTGEVSDELFGYKYTDFAPSEEEFQKEAEKRIKELYLYDVLRADRCIAGNSLEARVPFSDSDFVKYVMGIKPTLKMNHENVGKHLLRKSFEEGNYLPKHILYREKAAFSDAVGHRSVDFLKELAEEKYTDHEFEQKKLQYKETPLSKEALMYREIFDSLFDKSRGNLIPSYWMPNKEWENCDVDDPSARALPNYGKSGD
jgi:asparagine synthase (glutamine-hydrolysing)